MQRLLSSLRDRTAEPRQLAILIAASLAVLSMLVFGWQVWRVAGALSDARTVAEPLQDAIVDGDSDRARTQLARFDEATTRARENSDGALWWIGSKVPWLGSNVGAVSTVAREADAISDQAAPQIVDVADQVGLETFRPKDGRVNLKAVARILPVLRTTDQVFAHADAEVGSIEAHRLIGPLEEPVRQLQERVHGAAVGASSAVQVASLMPTMLGADGTTRRYVLLVLNNAEVRSLTGIPGSVAVISATKGELEMGEQGSITDVGAPDDPPAPIKPELRAGFISSVGTDIRDSVIIPDYPRAAELVAAIMGEQWEETYDGVIAVDPVALGYVLGGLGPVDIGDGLTINQNNAAATLLHGIYLKYPTDNAQQDDAFKLAARRSFDALTSGRGDSVDTIRGLVRGVQERRIFLWSRHSSEQQRIRGGGISGALSDDPARAEVGTFFNDGGSFKMSYFLRIGTELQARRCLRGDAQELRVTTTLRSDAPQDLRSLPPVVTGDGSYVAAGELRLHGLIVGPLGGRITALRMDGKAAPVGATTYKGRPVARMARVLPPGETTVIVADMVTPRGSPGAPVLRATPGVTPIELSASPSACKVN